MPDADPQLTVGRFLKIPLQPEGTDGWSEEQLRALVTRDCLIGVSAPLTPAQLEASKAGSKPAAASA